MMLDDTRTDSAPTVLTALKKSKLLFSVRMHIVCLYIMTASKNYILKKCNILP